MELPELQRHIVNNTLPNVLIFFGEDYALANVYLKMISENLGLTIRNIETIEESISENSRNEVFPENKLFVLKYPKDTSSIDSSLTRIKEEFTNNKVVIIFEQLDKRSKLFSQNKEILIDFSPLDDKTFVEMVKPIFKLSSENIKKLAKICKNNYGRYLQEVDKVRQYSLANNEDPNKSFEKLISEELIYTGDEDIIFSFIDSVLLAKKDMYKYYLKLKNVGESDFKLLSMLYNQYRNQFIVQTVSSATTESTGLTPYVLGACKRRAGVYRPADLLKALNTIKKIEQGIKSGTITEDIYMDYFLAEVLL